MLFSMCCFGKGTQTVPRPRSRTRSWAGSSRRHSDGYSANMVQIERIQTVTIRKSLDHKIYIEFISGRPIAGISSGVIRIKGNNFNQHIEIFIPDGNTITYVYDCEEVIVDGDLLAYQIICIGCEQVRTLSDG